MSSASPSQTSARPAEPAPRAAADWRANLMTIWLALVLAIAAVGLIDVTLVRELTITNLFFVRQDLPVAVVTAVFLFVLRMAPLERLPAFAGLAERRPELIVAGAVGLAITLGAGGWFAVCHAYPLSMDEFMAGFDAAIARRGGLTATIPEAWRSFAFGLQPQYVLRTPDGGQWHSLYLPMNAALRAVAGWATGGLCAAVGVVATYGVARRLWPERRDLALVAALLLATSSQLLVTAMTPYAMSAHLAFNMTWLWLFLGKGRASQVAAAALAVAACGLHQLIFHPLFAAPFILGLWLERRWGKAAFHTLVYAAAGLFWIRYWTLVMPAGALYWAQGEPGQIGAGFLVRRATELVMSLKAESIGMMAKNLLRFVTWQNPLLPGLAMLGLGAAIRGGGVLRCLVAGAGLTIVAFTVLMPFQGHGWGYRYLHGFLGSAALVAAFGWMKLTDALGTGERRVASTALALSAAFSLAVLLPVRAWQAERMIRPYATAAAEIARSGAEVVLIDPVGAFYAQDLVRNDPYLRHAPKLMDLGVLTEPQVRELCDTRRVALFDSADAGAAGIGKTADKPGRHLADLRQLLRSMDCDVHVIR